jgi:hypothetical protein
MDSLLWPRHQHKGRINGCLGNSSLGLQTSHRETPFDRDSKVIINWLNNQGKLQINTLLAWKDRISVLKQLFKDLSYSHSSREYNRDADHLSKSTLLGQAGVLHFSHWLDGHKGPRHDFKVF